jgi:uncharacterized protein
VEKIFHELDKKISDFQEDTGLKCISGCGKCCFNPEVEATILEFLPLAFHFYKSGKAPEIYENFLSNNSPVCAMLSPVVPATSSGFCSEYRYRGLICRLFGFSARRNKIGNLDLFTCKVIKENQPDEYRQASTNINSGMHAPVTTDYYMKLRSIDPDLGLKTYPINEAIIKAFEVVMNYYYFRDAGNTKYRKSS